MKKPFLLLLLLIVVCSTIKAQTVLDRILQQSKFHFQSTTWVDTSETKFYYDSMGLMTRKTIMDLRASTPALFEIDTNSYDSTKRLVRTKRYYAQRGSTNWNLWQDIEYSYSGGLLSRQKTRYSTYDYIYNTDSTLKEMIETQTGGSKIKTTYFYNSSKQLTHSFQENNSSDIRKDSFVYVGNQLRESIRYRKHWMTNAWDSALTYTYTYNTDGTLKEETVLLHQLGYSYGWNRYLYFYKTLSLNINEINKTKTVKIYPNPTAGEFTVELEENTPTRISITDLTGKQFFTSNTTSSLDIDLSHLDKGFYFVNVRNTNGVTTQKIIIQ